MSITFNPPHLPPPTGAAVIVRPHLGDAWHGRVASQERRMGGEWQITYVAPNTASNPPGMTAGSTYAVLPRFVETT